MTIGAMGRSIVWFVIGLVLATAGLLTAQHWRGPEATVLRSYDVRPEIDKEVEGALMTALSPVNGFPYGRVNLSPSGQLLVVAPPSIKAQTELRPGELLVLGQSSLSEGADADRALYYIVRATL